MTITTMKLQLRQKPFIKVAWIYVSVPPEYDKKRKTLPFFFFVTFLFLFNEFSHAQKVNGKFYIFLLILVFILFFKISFVVGSWL